MKIVEIDCDKIRDWNSFHEYFKNLFGFPDFYGRNMDAWIDCLGYLDEDDDMTKLKIDKGTVLTLQLKNVASFRNKCTDIYAALIECSAFVNYRRTGKGENPILALSFHS
jgi:RNAse (barnase) inhibitor barstar